MRRPFAYLREISKVSTILRIVPLPITFLGCGLAQNMTSLLHCWATKRPCDPPLSPFHSKPNEPSIEQSSLKVMSEGGGTFVNRAVNFSTFVTGCLLSVTNFSNKRGISQLLFIIGLTVAFPTQADDFGELAKRCAPEVSEDTLRALVRTESSFNPYAIGIVGGGSRQPKAFHEAMTIIAQLELEGKNYSVGLAQINKKNFSKLGINAAGALDACTNLKAASKILSDCYQKAQNRSGNNSLHDALSCYYSGNFQTGYRHGYVDKVRANAGINVNVQTVPSIREAETKSKESSTLVATGDNSSTGLIF